MTQTKKKGKTSDQLNKITPNLLDISDLNLFIQEANLRHFFQVSLCLPGFRRKDSLHLRLSETTASTPVTGSQVFQES